MREKGKSPLIARRLDALDFWSHMQFFDTVLME